MANHFSILALSSMKMQNDMTLKDELPRSIGAQYAIGKEWRNNSRKNKDTEARRKQCPIVDVTGDKSNTCCCEKQYHIEIWNVRSMNEGRLEVGQTDDGQE